MQLKHHLGALKKLPTLILIGLLPACSWLPGFDDPQFAAHPYYTQLEVEGRAGMGGPLIPLSDFGLRDHDSDYGGAVTYGDGFSGLKFDALLMDQSPKKTEILPANYGTLMGNDSVRSEFKMQAYHLSYNALVYDYVNEDEEWWVKAGIGAMISYQEIKFRVKSATTLDSERFTLRGGIPFPMATLAAGRGPLSVTATYGYNDDAAFGSDFSGSFQDVEVRAAYYFEDQDITLFAGWRRLDLPGSKTDDGFRVDADFKISGVFLGLELTF
jgi:hypothetical protein